MNMNFEKLTSMMSASRHKASTKNYSARRAVGLVVSTLILALALRLVLIGYLRKSEKITLPVTHQEGLPSYEYALQSVDESGLSCLSAVLQTTRGKIKFKFYSKDAPITSRRIAELIDQKFYNGLVFHRVVPGFVVQTGDPTGNGTGGSGKKLPPEFNPRTHKLGTVALARASDPQSGDSQFYITLGDHPRLDGHYTVFGQVVEGFDVLQDLQVGDQITTLSLMNCPL